jgi:hypothetical protein
MTETVLPNICGKDGTFPTEKRTTFTGATLPGRRAKRGASAFSRTGHCGTLFFWQQAICAMGFGQHMDFCVVVGQTGGEATAATLTAVMRLRTTNFLIMKGVYPFYHRFSTLSSMAKANE